MLVSELREVQRGGGGRGGFFLWVPRPDLDSALGKFVLCQLLRAAVQGVCTTSSTSGWGSGDRGAAATARKRRSQSRRYPRILLAEWWRRGLPRRSSRRVGLLGGREPWQSVRRWVARYFARRAGEAQAFPRPWL